MIQSSQHELDLGALTATSGISGCFVFQQYAAYSPPYGLGMARQAHYRHFCLFELSLIGSELLVTAYAVPSKHYEWRIPCTRSPENYHSIDKAL